MTAIPTKKFKKCLNFQGSVTAMAVTVPLDTARTRMILAEEGGSKVAKKEEESPSTIKAIMKILREEGM